MPLLVRAHKHLQFYAELKSLDRSHRLTPVSQGRLERVLSQLSLPFPPPPASNNNKTKPNPILEHLLAWRKPTRVEMSPLHVLSRQH